MTNRYLKSVYTYDKSCEYTANSGMEGFFMLGIWIAVLSGALMSIQGVFNTNADNCTHPVDTHRLLCFVTSVFSTP